MGAWGAAWTATWALNVDGVGNVCRNSDVWKGEKERHAHSKASNPNLFIPNSPLPFLHRKQSVSRVVCKPNSISPATWTCNCQNAPPSGISNSEARLVDTSRPLMEKIYTTSSKIQRNSIFFVSTILCRVAMCLHSVYPIPKPYWLVFRAFFFFFFLVSSLSCAAACKYIRCSGVQTWNFAIFFMCNI